MYSLPIVYGNHCRLYVTINFPVLYRTLFSVWVVLPLSLHLEEFLQWWLTRGRPDGLKLMQEIELYKINFSDTCTCGSIVENAQHYFLECELYDNIRPSLVRTIANNGGSWDIKLFYMVIPHCISVHTYIKQSNIFWHGCAELELRLQRWPPPPPSPFTLHSPPFTFLSLSLFGPAHYFYALTIYVTLYLALFCPLFTNILHPSSLVCI